MSEPFYEHYWKDSDGHFPDFPLKWPKLAPHIPRQAGVVIADFGCGPGRLLAEMKALNPGARYIGLDVSETALAAARRVVPEAAYHLITDGGAAPLPDASVDFLISSEVIEHIYDTENAVREMARIVKPGGTVVLTTPYHGFLKNLAIVFHGFDRHFDPVGPHVRFFSRRTLGDLLRRHGFGEFAWDSFGRIPPLAHSMIVRAVRGK